MPTNLNHRPPGASSALLSAEDEALSQPATLGDLADIAPIYEALPCWCPDAPNRHSRDCHIEAIKRLVGQYRCVHPNICDCPNCRVVAAIHDVGVQLRAGLSEIADALYDIDKTLMQQGGHGHRPLREAGGAKPKADPSVVERRMEIIVNAADADAWERAEDGYGRPLNIWCCPTHEDDNPSLHINPAPDGSGYILVKCQSGGDECGNKYPKGHPLYKEHRSAWIRELARLLDIPTGTFYPIRKSELPDDHEAPF
jgi:hypothetical protein